MFESLLDHEQDVFSRQKTANSHVQTILAVNTILQVSHLLPCAILLAGLLGAG